MINKYCDNLNNLNASLTLNKQILDSGNEVRNGGVPTMLKDGLSALILHLLIKQPKTILELGTATGISGSTMLLNVINARLTTIEKLPEMQQKALTTFKEYGVINRVESLLGDSLETAVTLCENGRKFDFIFLDCNKSAYVKLYPYLKKMLNVGGVLVADNVLFRGYVGGDLECPKEYRSLSRNLDNFNQLVANDKDMLTNIYTVGDGVLVSYKLTENTNE